ncbi:MAG TPA: hypothetical protein VF077_13080 [Nitrospiraceae bacterium]
MTEAERLQAENAVLAQRVQLLEAESIRICKLLVDFADSNNSINLPIKLRDAVVGARELWAVIERPETSKA